MILKEVLALTLTAMLSIQLIGCVTTKIKGYTDRDFNGHKIRRIVVRAPDSGFSFGGLLEESIVRQLKFQEIEAKSFLEIFPPTREWTNEKVANDLTEMGYDAIIFVNLVGSESASQFLGYINTGSSSTYGNTTSFNNTSIPVSGRYRYTSTRMTIYDVKTARKIWVGDASTEAGGIAFMADETQTDSIAYELVETLLESGHL